MLTCIIEQSLCTLPIPLWAVLVVRVVVERRSPSKGASRMDDVNAGGI